MEEEEHQNFSKKADPITFGSCISISLEGNENCFLSSQGFINSQLYVKKFDPKNCSNNFLFSVFRILPFSSVANFKNQEQLYTMLQDFNEQAKIQANKCISFIRIKVISFSSGREKAFYSGIENKS